MIGKLLKTLLKSGKTATKSVGKSMEFIDDVLEKEYISTAVDNLKTSSGLIVEKAGQAYQTTVNAVDKNLDLNKIDFDTVKDFGEDLLNKGKDMAEEISEKIQDKANDLKDVYENSSTMQSEKSTTTKSESQTSKDIKNDDSYENDASHKHRSTEEEE